MVASFRSRRADPVDTSKIDGRDAVGCRPFGCSPADERLGARSDAMAAALWFEALRAKSDAVSHIARADASERAVDRSWTSWCARNGILRARSLDVRASVAQIRDQSPV